MPSWTEEVRRRLVAARRPGEGWGYRAGGESAVEPSVLAALALLASAEPTGADETRQAAAATCRWLGGLQSADGPLGVTARLRRPYWPTALAAILWSVVGGFGDEVERAVRWLLAVRGRTWEPEPDQPEEHDTTLAGWPWVEGTHSWLEPTAWAILALCRQGYVEHPRVAEGVELVLDRQVPSGGWNYGNSSVFGTALRAQPAATGLALAALAAAGHEGEGGDGAVAWLTALLPRIRTGRSLGWGLIGLTAWGRRPPEADRWLAETAERMLPHETTLEIAIPLLAADPAGLLSPAGAREGVS
ncbi:MAG: hypothetical protein R3325_05460 [Thermoanaerobaculia bacterium]|nr:hypothetical protein [Thermoanaerobaculia bacterium]